MKINEQLKQDIIFLCRFHHDNFDKIKTEGLVRYQFINEDFDTVQLEIDLFTEPIESPEVQLNVYNEDSILLYGESTNCLEVGDAIDQLNKK